LNTAEVGPLSEIDPLDGNLLSVTSGEAENQVDLSGITSILSIESGTADDISQGDQVLVIASGDLENGDPVDGIAVTVNQPADGGGARRGFGDRGGLSGTPIGTVSGSVSKVDDSQITVDTDTGAVTVNLQSESTIQIYKTGTINDLTEGVSVLVVTSTDDESGAPVTPTSVVINPPEFGRQFGDGGFGGSFGGRPQRP
jgi:hypothetical protein